MINNIQALRAIAAIYVVVYHAASKLQIENSFTHIGESGVDLFFIISGFVITYSTLNSHVDWKTFIIKRLIRIVPLYWFLTLLFSSVLLLFPSVFKTYTFDVTKVIYSLLFFPQTESPVVYTGWTLNYEMYFYALFTVGLFLNKHKATFLVILFLITSVIIGTFATQSTSAFIHFISSPLLLEFVLGVSLCHIYNSGIRLSFNHSLFFIFSGVICFFIFKDASRLLAYCLPWLLIFVGVVFHAAHSLKMRSILFCGDASYSIYLVQAFTLPALHFITGYFSVITELNVLFFLVLYILVSVLSGALCFVLIERPFMNVFKNSKVIPSIPKVRDR